MSESAEFQGTWRRLAKCDLKTETEALICAAQEQALRTNDIKCKINKMMELPLC